MNTSKRMEEPTIDIDKAVSFLELLMNSLTHFAEYMLPNDEVCRSSLRIFLRGLITNYHL
jgi:hypothetical protein